RPSFARRSSSRFSPRSSAALASVWRSRRPSPRRTARAFTWPTRPRAGRPSPSSFRSLRSPPQWSRDCSPPSRRCRADGGIVGIAGDRRATHPEPAPDPHPPAAAARTEITQAGALDDRRRTPGRYSSKRAGWSNNGRSHRWPPTRPRESSKLRPGGCVNTVLIVTLDDALRARLLRGLGGFTIFEAPSDPEALKTLRLVEIDLVLRDSAGPAGALSTFVSGARDVAPSALVVAVGAAGEEEAAADFMVPDGFTTRELDAVLRHALEKQRLASQGRPLALHDVSDPDLVRELKLLQGVVATPLLAHGDLVAILVLGQPVFGAGYSRAEIETLFDLVTQLATVIRDIALHQQLEREKEFTERILSHLSSGVVTIGRDQRVG